MDKLAFLDGKDPVEPTTAAAPAEAVSEPVVETPPVEGPTRGPDGKFVAKTPEAADAAPVAAEAPPVVTEPTPQAPAVPPEGAQTPPAQPVTPDPTKPPEGYVPIGVVQAMREELNAFKRQSQQANQPPPPQPGEEGYEQWEYEEGIRAEAQWSAKFNFSLAYANKTHGEDKVREIATWAARQFDADPSFKNQCVQSDDPVAFAFEEYEYRQALEHLRKPEARAQFLAMVSGQAAAQPAIPAPAPPPVVVAPPPQPSTPPRSIAAAPSAGAAKPGEQPVGPGVAFDSVFKD